MRSPAASAGRVLSLLAAFVATSVVAGVLLAGLGMPAVGATGVAARSSVDFFNSLPSELKQPPLSEKSTVLSADGKPLAEFYEENRINVGLQQIAPVMRNAIVAIEDSRFYTHGGVDPKGLTRAAAINYIAGDVRQGASTLTQQYVKNVLVESANVRGDEAGVDAATVQTKSRKLREIKLAIGVEKQLGKDEILNRYLNISYFGHRVYGVEAASRYYFGKRASQLNLAEAATLAGVVQLPAVWSPKDHPDKATERRNVVLRRMLDLKMIDQKAYQGAVATPLKPTITPAKNGCVNAAYNGFYCDFIQRLIVSDNSFSSLGKTPEERRQSLLRGGLRIQTTLVPKIQKAAWDATSKAIPPADRSGVATAAVTVEPGTGKVLAIAQNRLFDPAGGPGKVATNYATDFAYGGSGGFQTGSTFKPFTLATWLRKGKSLNSVVSAAAGPSPQSAFKSCMGRMVGSYDYSNAEGGGSKPMTVMEATYRSVNTAYVAMEKQLDLCDIAETAELLGVHKASPQPDDCTGKVTTKLPRCIPSLTLGPKELSPMTMAAAFSTFAAQGVYCTPIAVVSIKDRRGKSYPVPQPRCKRVLDKDVASGVNLALSKVLTQGTAARVGGIGRPAAGKTGTTDNSVDTWFVGYSAQRATAVWVGDPIPKKVSSSSNRLVRKTLSYRTIDGRRQGVVYGATFAAPIWKKIMLKAHDGLPRKGFSSPPAKMLVGEGVRVPGVAGRDVGEAVSILEGAGLRVDVRGDTPSRFPEGTVARTTPGEGVRVAKGSLVRIVVSSGPRQGNDDDNGNGPQPAGRGGRGGGRGPR